MALSSGSDIYKAYFDDPTLSDVTIRLSDRTIHVHRIVLCRRSVYFEKLILGGFRESGQKEIELHEDDPVVMTALFRYIYDHPYDDLFTETKTVLRSLAKVYVAGEKYQVQGLHENVTKEMGVFLHYITPSWLGRDSKPGNPYIEDFLAAAQIVFAGTTAQDKTGRAALIEFCVKKISKLRKLPAFLDLLREFGDLGAEMFAHENLSLEGSWYCDGQKHVMAVPRCPDCEENFRTSDLRKYRNQELWMCRSCDEMVMPVCLEHDGADRSVAWKWQ